MNKIFNTPIASSPDQEYKYKLIDELGYQRIVGEYFDIKKYQKVIKALDRNYKKFVNI